MQVYFYEDCIYITLKIERYASLNSIFIGSKLGSIGTLSRLGLEKSRLVPALLSTCNINSPRIALNSNGITFKVDQSW